MLNVKRGVIVLTLLSLAAAAGGCGGAMNDQIETAAGEQLNQRIAGVRNEAGPATDPDQPVSDQPAAEPTVTPLPAPPQVGGSPANPGPGSTPREPRQVEFTPMKQGAYSGIEEQMAVLITDEATWNRHWQVHASTIFPVPAAPRVDFTAKSLLAVYMGQKNTGGYSVEVLGIQEENGRLTVRVRQIAPAPGDMVTMALTQPFQIVEIPKVAADTELHVVWH